MDVPFGPIIVLFLIALTAAVIALVHFLARPKGTGDQRVSDALSFLEPRGGRHRFSLRYYERYVFVVMWWAGFGAVSTLVEHPQGQAFGLLALGLLLSSSLWLWHKGVLRSPAPRPRSQGPSSRLR